MTNCIGIDVGKQELVAFDGLNHRSFPNSRDLSELRHYLASTGSQIRIIFEPTSTYSRKLEELCGQEGITYKLLPPKVVPHLRHVEMARSKTDRTDSELLYLYGTRGYDMESDIPKESLSREISAILSVYGLLQRNRIALQGALDAMEQEPLMDISLCDLFSGEIERLKHLEKEILEKARIKVMESGAGKQLESLLSIPGIGTVNALFLLAFFRIYPDANRKQITALAGLDPVFRESGTSVHGKPHISKQGNSRLRKTLFQATLSAARFNPVLSQMYRRLRESGKPDKSARVAVARKLLLIAFAIFKSGKPFRSDNDNSNS